MEGRAHVLQVCASLPSICPKMYISVMVLQCLADITASKKAHMAKVLLLLAMILMLLVLVMGPRKGRKLQSILLRCILLHASLELGKFCV